MSRSHALEVLGLPPAASTEQLEEAYARRLRETDIGRLAGMDPAILAVAKAQRRRVEVAYRLLKSPDQVAPADLLVLASTEDEATPPALDGPQKKSFWRAIMLTLMMPGAGSWYAGGRLRGLVVMGLVCLTLIWMIRGAQAAMAAGPGNAPMAGAMALVEYLGQMRGPFYGLMLLTLADALVATWAHNDALEADPDPEQLEG